MALCGTLRGMARRDAGRRRGAAPAVTNPADSLVELEEQLAERRRGFDRLDEA